MYKILKEIRFDRDGLIPAIVQDINDKQVLMLAWMNKNALKQTITTGKAWFYSRSRKRLWMKGEVSGNIQKIKGIYLDCDKDCILLEVEQVGAACHTGYKSCFYRKLTSQNKLKIIHKKVFNPEKVYKKNKNVLSRF